MQLRRFRFSILLAGALLQIGSLSRTPNAVAQEPQAGYPQTTMTLYKVVHGDDGKQYVITRTGLQLPIPAPGIAKNATQMAVYRDPQDNFWYNDLHGTPVKVTAAQVQWKIAQLYAPQTVSEHPAYPPAMPPTGYGQETGQPVQQTTIYNNQPASSGSSALATGLAAAAGGTVGGMMGGMIGSAIADDNNYHGIPYGVPMYRDAQNHPYYVSNGNKTYVNADKHYNPISNDWNKQTSWDDRWNQSKHHNNAPVMDGSGAKPFEGFRDRGRGGFRRR